MGALCSCFLTVTSSVARHPSIRYVVWEIFKSVARVAFEVYKDFYELNRFDIDAIRDLGAKFKQNDFGIKDITKPSE